MRALILKLVVLLLALIGIHAPGNVFYVCPPGTSPVSSQLIQCEALRL